MRVNIACPRGSNTLGFSTNLQTIKDGIQEELDKAIAEKIEKRASQFENFSVENLDAMMAKLQAMKAAKIA